MAKVTVTESSLENIAAAIRAKLGVQTTYRPSEMAAAIQSIPTGGSAVLEHLSVTQNGTYTPGAGVDGFDQVTVNVSGGGGNVENASVFRWSYNGTTCWGIMKKLSGDVIGQNADNTTASISLVGDLMTVTFHGTNQAVEVLSNRAIKLKAYTTGRTLGPATMTEYTMAANDQQNFTTDNLYGGLYLEAESA